MKLTPRYYQSDAVESVWQALRRGADPVVELPTGSGKALCIAMLAELILANNGRILIATHVAELVSQNAAEFQKLTGIEPGILCAGLERTDKGHDVLFASVQSLYGPAKRGEIDPFDLIVVDECHLCADKDSDAKFYPTAFSCFPDARRVGLSATTFRMDGPVYGEGKYFSEKCYAVDTMELVREGFLAPLVGMSAALQLELDKLNKVAGEYDQKTVEAQQTEAWLRAVVDCVLERAHNRKHIGVFCSTVKVAEDIARIFTSLGHRAEYVVGDTDNRGDLLDSWKSGEFRIMSSVNVLSTGFNFPALDCIVCIRPTASLSLWIQLLGRGVRKAEGKTNCLLMDFSGNLEVHGGICAGMEECYSENKDGTFMVKDPKPNPPKGTRKPKEGKSLSDLDPMLATPRGMEVDIDEVSYVVIRSKTQDNKKLLMVNYRCKTNGDIYLDASQFVCVEYNGRAFEEAVQWFARRGEATVPRDAEVARIKSFGLPVPRRLTVRKNGKYINVLQEHF